MLIFCAEYYNGYMMCGGIIMICSKCKNEIPDNIIYCPMCGVSTGSVPVPPSPVSSGDDSRYAAGQQFSNTSDQASYQQGYGVNTQVPQHSYTQINGQIYTDIHQQYKKTRSDALKLAGIILACSFIIIVIGAFFIATEESGEGSSGNVLEDKFEKKTIIDFELSGEYDEEGRELVYNMSGKKIGYVFEGLVYIPVEEGYVMVCDMDGYVVGRTYDTTPEAAFTDHPIEEETEDELATTVSDEEDTVLVD